MDNVAFASSFLRSASLLFDPSSRFSLFPGSLKPPLPPLPSSLSLLPLTSMSSSPPKRPRSRSELLCDLTLARHSVSQLEAELSALSPNPNPHLPPAPTALVDGGETGIKGVEDEESIGGKVGEGKGWRWPLSRREYGRYGRQMMLSGVGLPGAFICFFFFALSLSVCRAGTRGSVTGGKGRFVDFLRSPALCRRLGRVYSCSDFSTRY